MNGDGEHKLTKQERRLLKKEEKNAVRSKHARVRVFKKVAIWGAGFALVGMGMFGLVKLGTGGALEPASLIAAFSQDDWAKGNTEAQVSLVEYSDFECPACASYYPIVKRLLEDYGDRMGFAYRHFPLAQHKNAKPAAYAAEAAGRQGKFWEMHDLIFANQNKWAGKGGAEAIFAGYAQELGLNKEQFARDTENEEMRAKVDAQLESGLKAGVNATPTFFINGEKITAPRSLDEFKLLIDTRLQGI